MQEDPIVAEIHRIRRELAARFNDDFDAMFADIQKRQEALGSRLARVQDLSPSRGDEQAGVDRNREATLA